MLFVTTYEIKPHLTKEETGELMATFASVGSAPGTIAHYVFVARNGGVVISEADDITDTYRNLMNYSQWMTFDTEPALNIEDAVPVIGEYLG